MRDLYLVALVVLASLAGTAVQPGPAKTSATTPTVATLPPDQQPEGPLTILCSSMKDKKCVARPEFPDPGFRVVIAFVPDPARTNLRLYFDRSIEAIANAAQDTGYTLFKYSLPWQASAPRVYGSLDDQNKATAQRRESNSYPGVLAFRSTSSGPTLAVLLVGESPTEGYRVEQLQHAFEFEPQLASSGDPLRVMGPCFSGTLNELERNLESQPGLSSRQLLVYSGTATTGKAWENVMGVLRKDTTYLATFLRTNETTSWALDDFLQQRLGFTRPLPALSESGTIFGKTFRKQPDLLHPPAPGQEKAILFRFPRGLSHVREAYQKDPSLNQSQTSELMTDRRGLALSGDTQDSRDEAPEFAPDSPVSHDAQLSAMSDALQHEQLQYAAVAATDILDLLFVANYLRTSVPDLRLVLLDADVLQTIPTGDGSLQGSLVIGTYPIYTESQAWMGREARVFSSQFEEAVYSATAALSFGAMSAQQLDKLPEFTTLRGDVIARDKDAQGHDQAVFWISAIGRDALWPVALRFRSDILMLGGADPLERFTPTSAPRYWLTLFVALLLVIFAWFTAFFTARSGGESPAQWCADLSLDSTRGNLAGRAYYLSGVTLAVCSVWMSVTGCQIGFFLDAPGRNFWRGFYAVGAVALTAFAFWLSRRALKAFREDSLPASPQYVSMFFFPWIIFLFATTGLANAIWPRPTEEGFFFSMRALELGSGLCPALPFLFLSLAFVVFSWTQLQRVVFLQERYCTPPPLNLDGSFASPQKLIEDLTEILSNPLLDQPVTALWSSVIAFGFTIIFGIKCLRSLEGQVFDYAFAFATAALVFALVLVVLRFWYSWRKLQALLEQLELHPMRDVFSHMPEGCSWSPIWQQSPRKRNYQLLAHSIESLEGIAQLPGVPALNIDEIRVPARELLERVAGGSREKLKTYQTLQNELLKAAIILAPGLTGDTKDQVEVFFALRYLTYIRYVMLHLRNLATFVTFGYMLLALSLGSYPFLAPRAIAWFLSLLLIGLSLPVVLVFLEMSRNAILSRLTSTTPGKADWGFATRTASFAALPLFSMLGSHFPFIGRYVFSWLQPALKSLH
jgi:hypothetical protein